MCMFSLLFPPDVGVFFLIATYLHYVRMHHSITDAETCFALCSKWIFPSYRLINIICTVSLGGFTLLLNNRQK